MAEKQVVTMSVDDLRKLKRKLKKLLKRKDLLMPSLSICRN